MISVVEKLCIGSTHNSTDRLVAVNNALELESSYGGFSELHGNSVMQSHIHCFWSRQSAMDHRRANDCTASMEERWKEHRGKMLSPEISLADQSRRERCILVAMRHRSWRGADWDAVLRWRWHRPNDCYESKQKCADYGVRSERSEGRGRWCGYRASGRVRGGDLRSDNTVRRGKPLALAERLDSERGIALIWSHSARNDSELRQFGDRRGWRLESCCVQA